MCTCLILNLMKELNDDETVFFSPLPSLSASLVNSALASDQEHIGAFHGE